MIEIFSLLQTMMLTKIQWYKFLSITYSEFLRPSIWFEWTWFKSNFQSVNKKRVNLEKNNLGINFLPTSQKFHPSKNEVLISFLNSFILLSDTFMQTWLAESFDLLKPCYFVDPKIIPDKLLNIPPECLISTDSTNKDQDWIPTKVSKPFPLLSEVFDHPLNNKAPKTHFDPASQHYVHSELPFLTAQSTIFNFKKQFWHISQNFSQSGSYAQIKTSSKVYEKFTSDNEAIDTDQSIPNRQLLELNKEPEEMVQPCQANNFEISDSEILRKGLHGYNAA